eukprot:3153124-Pleurochrysis_carterae.AAC.1
MELLRDEAHPPETSLDCGLQLPRAAVMVNQIHSAAPPRERPQRQRQHRSAGRWLRIWKTSRTGQIW